MAEPTSTPVSEANLPSTPAAGAGAGLGLAADLPLPGNDIANDRRSGVPSIPRLVYGTAWKAQRTTALVATALASGFRALDTAAQPKHYREDLVAAGLRQYLSSADPPVPRSSLYIQTKFTPSQAPSPDLTVPLPYDPSQPLEAQIRASLASSLANFDVSRLGAKDENKEEPYLDALILHSPLPTPSLTLEAWRVLESFVPHPVRRLGISNISAPELAHLLEHAARKPALVQNRFHRGTAHDGPVRALCRAHGLVYQAFWTLSANPRLLASRPVSDVAAAAAVSPEAALYALIVALGDVCVLDGTTNQDRMREDLEGLRAVEAWSQGDGGEQPWQDALASFRTLIKDTA